MPQEAEGIRLQVAGQLRLYDGTVLGTMLKLSDQDFEAVMILQYSNH